MSRSDKRIEIDEARADQRVAVVDAARDRSRIVEADEDDAVAFEHDLAVAQQPVTTCLMSHDPSGGEQDRTIVALRHGASIRALPSRATTRPRFTTSRRGAWLTTASVRLSPSTSTMSAAQPGARP